MSTILASISSNIFKKCTASSNSMSPPQFRAIPNQKLPIASIRLVDPTYVPGNSPPEVPTAPPSHNPSIPPEMPRRHNVPEFDPMPPENPSPELPESIPETPLPPSEPEVVPPSEPEISPPEPGLPNSTPPDNPPPIIGSNGLAFY